MMKKKGVLPTEPFKSILILRTQDGVMDRYKTIGDLYRDMWAHGVSIQSLYSNTLSHGHFKRSDEDVGMGRNTMVALSLRWCTGEPALEELCSPAIFVMDRKIRKGSGKRWASKKKHQKHACRNKNRVCRIQRYGKAQVVSEGEPPVRKSINTVPEPYGDWYDRFVSRSWKGQSKCPKQWGRKLK